MLAQKFFEQDAQIVAKKLLGKVLRHKQNGQWLSAMIIETEAYYLQDKASHASLGYTEKRKALFMRPGTIYMYYARGGDSFNISCQGPGNAVLIKSGYPYIDEYANKDMLSIMQCNNPNKNLQSRELPKLCNGQTLLCKSLALKVKEWNQKTFSATTLRVDDINYTPCKIIKAPRLGIPQGRDEHLLYRFIDYNKAAFCTDNPLRKRKWQCNCDYFIDNMI